MPRLTPDYVRNHGMPDLAPYVQWGAHINETIGRAADDLQHHGEPYPEAIVVAKLVVWARPPCCINGLLVPHFEPIADLEAFLGERALGLPVPLGVHIPCRDLTLDFSD